VLEIMTQVIEKLTMQYVDARDEAREEPDLIKSYYRSQDADRYRTKADVLRAIWAELPKVTDKAASPVDEELIAEPEKESAVVEGESEHNWGTSDRLWRSEVIDTKKEALYGVGDPMLDANGKRFANELGRNDYVTGEMRERTGRPSVRTEE